MDIPDSPFEATWESLQDYTVPDWYLDAKFGIFIHWGVYAVPAFGNEWYPRNMYLPDQPAYQHHLDTYGPHKQFGYKDFIPKLTAEKFDAREWAELFRKSGARYVVPVAEHHDGFPLYHTDLSEWCAAKMGPKRDVIGELTAAVREREMVFGVSSHRAEHWWFFDGGMQFESDVRDPQYAGLYGPARPKDTQPDEAFLEDWLARCCELVDKYRPQVFWFDWWIEEPAFEPYRRTFAAYYYNRAAEWGLGVAINYKNEAYPPNAAVYDIERGQLNDIGEFFWQTDTSVSKNSWGHITDQDYKTAGAIVHDLVDIVSKNGCLLLNVCPRPDGTIPEPEQEMLLEIGQWLSANGEAIYGTRPWKVFGEGPTEVQTGGFTDTKREAFTARDLRFTTKGDVLYVIVLGWPESGEVTVESLSTNLRLYTGDVGSVELLGSDQALQWSRDDGGLKVAMPEAKPPEHAFVLKITKQE